MRGFFNVQGRVGGLMGQRAYRTITIDCEGLISALSGGWYYPTGRDGQISHDLPRKPNHPHEDYGDSLCYLIGRIAPGKSKEPPKPIVVNSRMNARSFNYLGAKSAKWK